MANAPYFSFPGLDVVSGDFILTQGTTPSICRLECDVYDDDVIGTIGTLEFSDGGTTMQFRDCVIARAVRTPVDGFSGSRVIVDIEDRRWRWRYRKISMIRNIWRPGMTHGVKRYTVEETAKDILDALGETSYTVEFPFNDTEHGEVHWSDVSASHALAWLCEQHGAVISLGFDDAVVISSASATSGSPLPTEQRQYPPATVTPSVVPAKVKVLSAPIIATAVVLLEPVWKATDGRYNGLFSGESVPGEPDDWYTKVPPMDADLQGGQGVGVTDDFKREVAKTLWRVYRIYGFWDPSWLNQDPPVLSFDVEQGLQVSVNSIRDILPLLDYVDVPQCTPGYFHRRPMVCGEWTDNSHQIGYIPSGYRCGYPKNRGGDYPWLRIMKSGFHVDRNEGLVFFDEPIVSVATRDASVSYVPNVAAYYPPAIGLLCSFVARDEDTVLRFSSTVDVPNATTDETMVVVHDDVKAFCSQVNGLKYGFGPAWPFECLSDDYTPTGNWRTEVRDKLWKHANTVRNSLACGQNDTVEWSGFIEMAPVGQWRQVRWRAGWESPASTVATRNVVLTHASLESSQRTRRTAVDDKILPGILTKENLPR